MAAFLVHGMKSFFPEKDFKKIVFKQVNNTLFQFQEVEVEGEEDDNEKDAYIYMRVKEKLILRGEVLLYDLSPYLGELSITVEHLIYIIFLDFIKNIQANGNTVTMQENVVSKLKH
ncbi:hypothetical protein MXL46_15345 [Heyndrickxia sporothermodurans]|uniref:hypothetical protein n=1 Tax=Heyndrickxia sporothermodurans TaxID=46224 RepID=UPI002DB9A688|nr:hypothetical protein [Heyndrickxia sporothermodurans]MEB6550472.1 hypothetical protein [Heyndrickxia sporothermodurans]